MVQKQTKRYAKELLAEVNKDHEEHGKSLSTMTTMSRRRKGSNHFYHRSRKRTLPQRRTQEMFAYEAHTVCDNHNFILDVVVTAGNIHDSVAFDPLYDQLCQHYPDHKVVVADSAHKNLGGSAEKDLYPVGEYYPPPIPDQKERKTVIHGMSMSMTAAL